MIKKAFLCSALVLSLTASTIAFAEGNLTNFIQQKTYTTTTFQDVNASDWYYSGIKSAFELGLMGGKAQGIFDTKGNLTLAEAVAIASRVHNVYNGGNGIIANTGSQWYDGAVSYAIKNGIIKSTDFADYNKLATRAQMAYIFASTLESKDLSAINKITKLPDVTTSTTYSDYIFKLYNAGVIGGSDAQGTFKPSSNITRAEAVAILKNLVVKSDRKVLSLSSNTTPAKPTTTGGMLVSKERVRDLATAISIVGPDSEYADPNFRYVYAMTDEWGVKHYRQIPKNPTAIQTKYGEHTYGCYDQATYDFVIQKIEAAKKIATFNEDSAWQRYYKIQNGGGTDKEKNWVSQWKYVNVINTFGEAKAKELYVILELAPRLIRDTMTIVDRLGESAYEQLTTGSDCNGAAHLESAVWDSYGYSTRIMADNSHAWNQVKLSDGKWHDVTDLNVGTQETRTSYSESGFVLVPPTY